MKNKRFIEKLYLLLNDKEIWDKKKKKKKKKKHYLIIS